MTSRMAGKSVLVVGAGSSGAGWSNGKAAAVLYAREGARVACLDLRREAAEATAAIIRSEGQAPPLVIAADITDGAAVHGAVAETLAAFGAIDVLHHNVGIVTVGGPVETAEPEWDRLMAVNVTSLYRTLRATLPVMERQGRGAIVAISSIAAFRYVGYPSVAYAASKGAVNQIVQNIAVQYAARGIRANAVMPGLMDTPMVTAALADAYGPGGVAAMRAERARQVPMGFMGTAWDVAHASLFLASDEARYISGTTLVVDGALTAKFS